MLLLRCLEMILVPGTPINPRRKGVRRPDWVTLAIDMGSRYLDEESRETRAMQYVVNQPTVDIVLGGMGNAMERGIRLAVQYIERMN